MVRDDEIVQESSRLSKTLEMYFAYHQPNMLYTRPERQSAKADLKKANARPSSPFLWFNFYFVFFSFLFVQIFPCGQIDRLFQMDHGAISPSLMVLFCKVLSFYRKHNIDKIFSRTERDLCSNRGNPLLEAVLRSRYPVQGLPLLMCLSCCTILEPWSLEAAG